MPRICAIASLVVGILFTASLRAEGLLYHLAEDGFWAKFEFVGNALDRDGKETTMSGSLTMSSVGTTEVDGQKCRWIELTLAGKRNDQAFTSVEKLLIPEKRLARGEEPLPHVLKAWTKHSDVDGGAAHEIQDVQNPESNGGRYVRGDHLSGLLHGPYDPPEQLEKAVVESKLGKRECDGISARERKPGKPSHETKFVIRLHEEAPFGVVTWDAETKIEQDDKLLLTMTVKAKLSDFGKDAKSAIPEAK